MIKAIFLIWLTCPWLDWPRCAPVSWRKTWHLQECMGALWCSLHNVCDAAGQSDGIQHVHLSCSVWSVALWVLNNIKRICLVWLIKSALQGKATDTRHKKNRKETELYFKFYIWIFSGILLSLWVNNHWNLLAFTRRLTGTNKLTSSHWLFFLLAWRHLMSEGLIRGERGDITCNRDSQAGSNMPLTF